MDEKFSLVDEDKENSCELSLDVEQIMSGAPIVQFSNKSSSLAPFAGRYYFKFGSPVYHQVNHGVVTMNSLQKVYITPMRSWPITFSFRPPVTPADFWIRITPMFSYAERCNEVVQRCKKHESQTSSGNGVLEGKSFVEILGCSCQYIMGSSLPNCPATQITVRTSIDVLQLLHFSKSQPPSSSAELDMSQSLLPEVTGTIHCRLSCYNSCLGLTSRGEVELVITLEKKASESSNLENFEILGLDKICVRCCSCPTRDVKSDYKYSDNSSESSSVERNSRRLSLNLSDHSNVHVKSGGLNARYSCPTKIQRFECNKANNGSFRTVIIGGRKYFIIMTDDQAVATSSSTLRNSSALISERWISSGSQSRKLKRIQKFYQKLEHYAGDCIDKEMSRNETDPTVSHGSQDSTSSVCSMADKCVGTDGV
ncbi:unnamed protein product [Heterobilharzia americana]|nr:unnamed protein product [Heterobilharzia americana]